jgi:hypothetical protein
MMSVLHAIYKCMATLVPVLPDDLGKARDGDWFLGGHNRLIKAARAKGFFAHFKCPADL